jgi:tctex1 domain-containing protein 2
MDYDRYKFIVNVILGEMRGEGVKVAARCFWDADTDNLAQDTYINVFIADNEDTLFCVAGAYGIFYY